MTQYSECGKCSKKFSAEENKFLARKYIIDGTGDTTISGNYIICEECFKKIYHYYMYEHISPHRLRMLTENDNLYCKACIEKGKLTKVDNHEHDYYRYKCIDYLHLASNMSDLLTREQVNEIAKEKIKLYQDILDRR